MRQQEWPLVERAVGSTQDEAGQQAVDAELGFQAAPDTCFPPWENILPASVHSLSQGGGD